MSAIFSSINTQVATEISFIICLVTAFACGIIAAFAASFRNYVSKSFVTSLILLPVIVHTVITMVNGNVGTGVAVMGAFSLVRFRSVPGRAKDIVSIFLVMTVGLACAAGYVGIALIVTICVSLAMIIISGLSVGDARSMDLSITVPETLRFIHEFDDIFEKYTKGHRLVRTKTTNMGSLYKLYYRVELKDRDSVQEFIDQLRCRNGNLEISICESSEGNEDL